MLSVNRGCAAGIIVGYDEKVVYIATAAHIADLSTQPFPAVAVRFEGLSKSPIAGEFWPQFEKSKITRRSRVHVQIIGLNDATKKVSEPSRRKNVS